MRITEIETPAVVVDLDIMERNLARVAQYAQDHALRLRPHTKTHKSPIIARRQLDLGAAGLTVAKVGEAEVMMTAAPDDLLVAYPVIGHRKLERLMALAENTRITVAVDSVAAAHQLSDAAREHRREIGVLIEVDMGLKRVGVQPSQAVAFTKSVLRLPHLRYEGVAMYPGHIKMMDETGMAAIKKLSGDVESLVDELTAAGLKPPIVSGGSTPALYHSHHVAGLNEIRPGTYVFNDRNTLELGSCAMKDCAATVLCTVVSTAQPGQIILDGGSKTFSSDRLATGADAGFGELIGAPEAIFTKLMEEHGFVDVHRCHRKFEVGEQVSVLMNHVCVVMNLHEQVYGVRNGVVEEVWKVEARGKLQ
ncbi:MAG: alanine racemase [Acidobacteria bacterium]|nr:alanine racemase [Acidobacteriota bacterium]